ncbi:MAG: BNR-4 repeat-containing protein [Planctomycetota bacterium]|nr:BNR-4 repeat-containing protein [Planctomycetota bacterium]
MEKLESLKPSSVVELGDGYASTAVNTTIYRHHGLVTRGHYQFTSFYLSENEFVVLRRDLRNDEIEIGRHHGSFNPRDVHNSISLGVDPEGFLHLSYNHHGNPLSYRRSVDPLSVKEWSDPMPMTGRWEDKVTYPCFVMWPRDAEDKEGLGRLLFLYRHWGSGQGDICLKEYDHADQSWRDVAERFVKGMDQTPWTSNAYWNHPVFDSQGNLLLSWVWRVVQTASARGDFIFNHNHGFAKSPDGRRWYTSRDVELSLPMTQVNSEIIWATTPGNTIANMASSAVDSKDHLHVAIYGSESPGEAPQYQHIWFDGKKWRCDAISQRETSFGLLTWDVPMSRPEIIVDSDDNVFFIYRCDLTEQRLAAQRLEPPDYAPPGETFLLWDQEVKNAEPIVDRIRWARDGVLSLLVQRNTQPDLLAEEDKTPEPVRIIDWQF